MLFFSLIAWKLPSLQICFIILGLHTHIILPSPFIIFFSVFVFFCMGSFPVVPVYTILSTHENEINSWPQTWSPLQTEFLHSSLPWFAQVCFCLAYGCVSVLVIIRLWEKIPTRMTPHGQSRCLTQPHLKASNAIVNR